MVIDRARRRPHRRRGRGARRLTSAAGPRPAADAPHRLIIIIPVIVIGAVLGTAVRRGGVPARPGGRPRPHHLDRRLARLVRGEFLTLREREFVDAARVAGASRRAGSSSSTSCRTPSACIIVNTTLLMSRRDPAGDRAVSYLGFGVSRPDVSLGLLISRVPGGVRHPAVAVLVAGPVHRASACASTSSATACATRSTRGRSSSPLKERKTAAPSRRSAGHPSPRSTTNAGHGDLTSRRPPDPARASPTSRLSDRAATTASTTTASSSRRRCQPCQRTSPRGVARRRGPSEPASTQVAASGSRTDRPPAPSAVRRQVAGRARRPRPRAVPGSPRSSVLAGIAAQAWRRRRPGA